MKVRDARAFGLPTRDANYTTLLMSTGLTFGTIAALYGLTNGYIDQSTYTILVTVVILSAVGPTLVATTFFEPQPAGDEAFEDFEAAEEIDAGPLRPPGHTVGDCQVATGGPLPIRFCPACHRRIAWGRTSSIHAKG